MNFHPLANIFPLIDGQAYSDLIADVVKHGVREPVWLYEGQILDGRNRWRAAEVAGVECPTRDYEGDEPVAFIASLNRFRRHETPQQQLLTGVRLAEALSTEAETRMKAGTLASIDARGKSSAKAAELVGVSQASLERAQVVVRDGAPELLAAFERGEVSVSAAAQVATLPQEMQADIVATGSDEVREVAKTIRNAPHVSNNSGNNEWYTPPRYIDAARKAMGGIDTDPASSDFANKTVRAKRHFTAESNGLEQKWTGRVWMNPPYSQPLITNFIDAAARKYEAGEFDEACVLVNNATETQWFQRLLEKGAAVCFIKGRIKYHDATGQPANTPLQGQAVVYLGRRPKSFSLAFGAEGTVLFHG